MSGAEMVKIMNDFNNPIHSATVIYEDNQSCLKIIETESYISGTKHIDVKVHYSRDQRIVELRIFFPTKDMVADLLTKPLANVVMKLFNNQSTIMELELFTRDAPATVGAC